MIISLLIVSACIIVFMVAVKLWEGKRQSETVITRTCARGDKYVVRFFVYLRRTFITARARAVYFSLVHLPARCEAFFSDLKHRSHGKYQALSVKMRGARPLSSRGNVSPFIRTLASRNDNH